MAPLKEPADKLPLAVRKNIRDKWEAEKPEIEKKISQALGETWTTETNPNLLYVYANEDYKQRIGDVITWYMDPFVSNIEAFVNEFGEDGKSELNSYCTSHKVVIAPQESTTFTYGGLEIKDGILRLVFAENYLGTNASDISRDFAKAIKAAPPPTPVTAYNLIARNSVRKYYDPKIESIRSAIATLVGMPDLKLNGNFEYNAERLAALPPDDSASSWDHRFGEATLDYFEGLQQRLESAGFKGDDMLQEGFQEGVPKGEIAVRIVDKLENSTYNEVVIEGDVLYIQTVLNYWRTNVYDAGSKILDIL